MTLVGLLQNTVTAVSIIIQTPLSSAEKWENDSIYVSQP